MRNVFLLFFVLLIISTPARPQTGTATLRGRVEAAGSPVHDATVVLLQSRRSVRTATDGTFEFRGLAPGRYEVIAHQHAFTDQKRTVDVAQGAVTEVVFT